MILNLDSTAQADPNNERSEPSIKIDSGLLMPGVASDHRINSMVNAAARKLLGERWSLDAELPLWPAEYFNLDQSSLFGSLDQAEQHAVLTLCSEAIVEEALLIEKCGMAFGVKMSALAESVEERMFYNMMASEEAIHYHQVRQFLPNNGFDVKPNVFHRLLADLIENGDRDSLVFIIQVVLEGWGLKHYKNLAESCLSEAFSKELKEILKDESRHHGTGVIFAKEREFSGATCDYTVEILEDFLMMIQVGPQSVLSAMETVAGPLETPQKLNLFNELDAENRSAEKLDTLRELMIQNGGAVIVERLEALNRFTPYPTEHCL